MRLLSSLSLLCLLYVQGTIVLAEAPSDPALRAFDQGDFAAAEAAYASAVARGLNNGHVFYNLGTVLFREGKVGESVAAFLAARRYLPRDADVQANLRFVLDSIHDKLDPETPSPLPGLLGRWSELMTVRELAVALALLLALSGTLLLLSLASKRLAMLRWPAFVSYGLPLLTGICLVAKITDQTAWGAVTAQSARVYSGPAEKNAVVFALQAGAPVLVTGKAAGRFVRIEISDGKKGWILDSEVKVY